MDITLKSKHIDIEVIKETEGIVYFKIIEQTHRGESFANSWGFKSKNRIVLMSVSSPEASGSTLYVRGAAETLDKKIVSCSKAMFKKYQFAIEEYNLKFSLDAFPDADL